jgi:hypothetical protein
MAAPANPTVDHEPSPWVTYPECPDCRVNVWELGPRGGASANIRCTGCGRRFNTVLWGRLIQRLPPANGP